MPNATCATPNCETVAAGRGKYCAAHSPRRVREVPIKQRIMDRIRVSPDGCWVWIGYVNKQGTAALRYGSTNVFPHRFLYEDLRGETPSAYLEPTCDNAVCVNPEHRRATKPGPKPTAAASRFWPKVAKGEEQQCWLWQGHANAKGYGTLYLDAERTRTYAHRFSYELHVAPIPDGIEIDHTCHTPACVNPRHLRLATHALNSENRSGPPSNNTSGHLGVYFETRSQRWIAQVTHRGSRYSARFATKAEANEAAIAERNRVFKFNILDRV